MKIPLLVISAFLVSCTSCTSQGPVKVYKSWPEDGVMLRKQSSEAIPFKQTEGWLCVTPDDAKILLEHYSKDN